MVGLIKPKHTQVVKTPTSDSIGAGFESLTRARYPDFGFSCFFLSLSRQIIVNHYLLTSHRDIPFPLKYRIHLNYTELKTKILILAKAQCALCRSVFVFRGAITWSSAKNSYIGASLWERKATEQITISLQMLQLSLTLWSMSFGEEKLLRQLDWRKY